MRKALIVWFGLILSMSPCFMVLAIQPVEPSSGGNLIADRETTEIVQAANEGWQKYRLLIPLADLREYGFRNQAELAIVALGDPVEIYAFTNLLLTDGSAQEAELVEFTRHWRVPLKVRGEFRAFVTVADLDGRLTAVEFGAAGLAGEMGEFWQGLAPGQKMALIRYYPRSADFVGVRRAREPVTAGTFYSLRSGQAGLRKAGIQRTAGMCFQELVQSVRKLPFNGE